MGRMLGFVGLLIVLGIGSYIYMRQAQSVAPAGTTNPQGQIDLTGVKNDLLAIAQAERNHQALNGGYVSMEQLRSAGELTMSRASRGPYTYSTELSDSGFRAVATYSGPPGTGMPASISVDQSMQFSQQ